MQQKNIGILTGGGDCSGLNPAIKNITQIALDKGFKVIGIKDGWKGLSYSSAMYQTLNDKLTDRIDQLGGTILGTSRTNPYHIKYGVENLLNNWKQLNLYALVTIGGEDTLGVSAKLFDEYKLPIVGIPKTIDFDIFGTEYTLGFESAIDIITKNVDSIRSTAESHSRVFIIEVMGRKTGHLALYSGISTGAQIILIPEVDFELDRVGHILTKRKYKGFRHSIVIVAESAKAKGHPESLLSNETDQFGHVRFGGIGNWLANSLSLRSHLECRFVNLGHLQRSGPPVSYDRRMGFLFGAASIQAIQNGFYGVFTSLSQGKTVFKPLSEVKNVIKCLDVSKYYDVNCYQPKYTHEQ